MANLSIIFSRTSYPAKLANSAHSSMRKKTK